MLGIEVEQKLGDSCELRARFKGQLIRLWREEIKGFMEEQRALCLSAQRQRV